MTVAGDHLGRWNGPQPQPVAEEPKPVAEEPKPDPTPEAGVAIETPVVDVKVDEPKQKKKKKKRDRKPTAGTTEDAFGSRK